MATSQSILQTIDDATTGIAARLHASVAEVRSHRHGGGAGIIWRPDGAIVTNYHVAPADTAEVQLADGRSFAATSLGRDEANDLAILSIAARDLPAAAIGDARMLRPGDLVLAVGHPLGVRYAVTTGVVMTALPSARRPNERELLRADVRLLPGNSGGPLADARGRVVGVNAMVAGGMALAVPSHLAERLLANVTVRPLIGVEARDVELTPALASRASVTSGKGALVVGVRPGGPAERSGLMVGDVVLAVDGHFVDGTDGLMAALAAHPGGTIHLGLLRGGAPSEVTVRPEIARPRAA